MIRQHPIREAGREGRAEWHEVGTVPVKRDPYRCNLRARGWFRIGR
jgi:hypothetical protein